MEIDEIPVGRAEDLRGQRFGQLTVLYRVKQPLGYKTNGTYWKCKCDCGNFTIARSADLKRGSVKGCGCLQWFKNEIGNRYGRLIVIKRMPNDKHRNATWLCKCDCGNTIITTGQLLRSGHTQSCGCLHKEQLSQRSKKQIPFGTRYGHLIVIDNAPSGKNGRTRYQCKCDCGSKIIVDANNLRQGVTKSCGCIRSQGEIKISNILHNNNINFIKEKSFKDCRSPKNRVLRFDFYVNNNYLIEYDGEQHFYSSFGLDAFKSTQKHDKIKNEYCKTHNIPLIRIPYTHYDKITIEDLKPETSQFLIT